MYHNFLIHLSADGHLGCFHVLDIVNSAAMNIEGSCVFFQFWFPQCVYWAVGLLGCLEVLFPVFKGMSTLFSIVAVPVCIPTNSERRFLLSTPSPKFIVCRLFDDGHSYWREMIPHCDFDLHFSNNERCWVSFHVFVSLLYVFFGELSV